MGTVRAWWPQLLRAGGAAALAPAAILVALVVLGAGGGLGGLGSLSQLFSGPNVPPPLRAAARFDVAKVRSVPLPRTGLAPATAAAGNSRTPGGSGGSGSSGSSGGSGSSGSGSGGGAGGRGTTPTGSTGGRGTTPASTPASTPAAGGTPATPTPTPAPTPKPTLLTGLTDPVKKIVGSLPAPLGPVGAGAITTVVTTVDTLLKKK